MDESGTNSIVCRRLGRRRLGLLAACTTLVGGCSAVDLLNVVAPDRLAASGLRYGDATRQELDVYRPKGPGPFPVAMFVYGGDWSAGDRAMYRFVGGALAASGVLTVIPDYRLYPAVRFPTFLSDNALALRWTREQASRWGGDDCPPCLIGHSAGAYNVSMLTLDSRWLGAVGLNRLRDIRGCVGLAGPYDFLPFGTAMLRDLFAPDPDERDTQPINHVDGRSAPMLLLAGSTDRTVLPDNTTRLAAQIRAAGGKARDIIYPGVDHREIIGAFGVPFRFLAPSLRDTIRFVRS